MMMKIPDQSYPLHTFIILAMISCLITSCKKDDNNSIIETPFDDQRVIEIATWKGGLERSRAIFHYSGEELSQYILSQDFGGEWKDYLKYEYNYMADDKLVEIRSGISDSVWFFSFRWDKTYEEDRLLRLTNFSWSNKSVLGPGIWVSFKETKWEYESDRLVNIIHYTAAGQAWEELYRYVYLYEEGLWTGVVSLVKHDMEYDTLSRSDLHYETNNLAEVNSYNYIGANDWIWDQQYIFDYDGNQLTSMIINDVEKDSIIWKETLSVTYNEFGNPDSYTHEYSCCPAETVLITYENKRGNFQRATAGNSTYQVYPWLPAPIKNIYGLAGL